MKLDPKDGWYSQDFGVRQRNVGMMEVDLLWHHHCGECEASIRIRRYVDGVTMPVLFRGSLAELIDRLEANNE